MEAKRTKQDDEIEEDQKLGSEDWISELPDGIIIDILSRIPTVDAIRTSVLSKRWRHMWTLVSAVDISDNRDTDCFRRGDRNGTGRKKVLKFVEGCLKYPYANTTISRFKFEMKFDGWGARIDKWLRFPVLQNVKELVLDIRLGLCTGYVLPHQILGLRGLTLLYLSGNLVLKTAFPVSLPSLKVLHLMSVLINDQVLNNVLSGCPSLKELFLINCLRLFHPQVLSSSIKLMKFGNDHKYSRCRSIKVEATNLQSFVYGGRPCRVNLVRCRAIRNITLKRASLAEPWLDDLVPQLPLLESLVLDTCYGLKRINISNQHLKNFSCTLDMRLDSLEATIDAPSLVSFSYTGLSMIKISVDAPNLVLASIRICDYPRKSYDEDWYVRLINFLSELNGCNMVRMFCSSKKAFIIPDELKKIHQSPFPDLKYLTVKAPGSVLHRKNLFRKSLLWIAPSLEVLSIE